CCSSASCRDSTVGSHSRWLAPIHLYFIFAAAAVETLRLQARPLFCCRRWAPGVGRPRTPCSRRRSGRRRRPGWHSSRRRIGGRRSGGLQGEPYGTFAVTLGLRAWLTTMLVADCRRSYESGSIQLQENGSAPAAELAMRDDDEGDEDELRSLGVERGSGLPP